MRSGEQASREQHERREDADELDRQQPQAEAHPTPDDQGQADRTLQRGDQDQGDLAGHETEEEDVRRCLHDALRRTDPGEELEHTEPEEDQADRDPQHPDAVAYELVVDEVLEVDEALRQVPHA